MRVATISVYKQATYQLNRLTSDLAKANEVVSTNSRINTSSDDPSGTAQVLGIDSSISCMDQCQINVQQGLTVLTTAETALDSMADQLLELNLLCTQLANASSSSQERTDAADSMQIYLDQLVDLANTEAYGGYVFAGDENQVVPFCYDDEDYPTSVIYNGSNDSTSIKTGEDRELSIDCCGCDLFYEDEILVDGSNYQIVFQEDPGTGTENILTIDAIVPSGSYTREELADIVEDTLTQASLEDGYGITYQVSYDETSNTFSLGTDGTYEGVMETTLQTVHTNTVRISNLMADGQDFPDMEIEIITPANLTEYTPEPEGSAPLTLTYTEDGTWTIENDPGYGLPAQIEGEADSVELDLDDDGIADIVLDLNATPEAGTSVCFDIVQGFENNSILPDLGFDSETVQISPCQSSFEVGTTFAVVAGENDAVDFIETLAGKDQTSEQLTAIIEPGTYTDPESYARAVEEAMEAASAQSGNRVNYQVTYDEDSQTFSIREDTDTGRQLESFDLLFSRGTNSETSAANDLGFYAQDIYSGPVQGLTADWSIFDTIFDLEEALAANDVDSIQRAMIRLENHYENITSAMASVGRAYSSLIATESRAAETETSLTTQRSEVADADTVESVMNLNSTQTTYEAALSSCSKIMDLSLVNYL